jgi:hypothetical protein
LLLACLACAPTQRASFQDPSLGDERVITGPAGPVACRAALLDTYAQSRHYFGFESRELVPVVLACTGVAAALRVEVERAEACSIRGPLPVVPVDRVIEEARKSWVGPTVVLAVLFGVAGLAPALASGAVADQENRSIEQDFHAKAFRPRVLNPGEEGFGAIFFRIGVRTERVEAVTLSIVDLASGQRTQVVLGNPAACSLIGRDE